MESGEEMTLATVEGLATGTASNEKDQNGVFLELRSGTATHRFILDLASAVALMECMEEAIGTLCTELEEKARRNRPAPHVVIYGGTH